ncbi:SDR family NAD(P)-dependent oxidoreductase [Oricola indica]|jgi:hypothetical protein|uniref:SDR family NAD(P)-dependent oxidoreductase n=1 Tax=Oricola indica TaxID=2872591 RepID=UPI001CC15890|nr:SDR family oxidoreductase [Oricola indica]
MRTEMRIELDGKLVAMTGVVTRVTEALGEALSANGATVARDHTELPDILIVALPLIPDGGFDWSELHAQARETGLAMKARGSGRIVFLMSAMAAIPMRRHPDYSVEMAAVLAALRGLAMSLAPEVVVNGIGAGTIGDPACAGDTVMIGHTPIGRAGTIDDICNAALFLCDPLNSYLNGQLLPVDGGWSVGYGRSF